MNFRTYKGTHELVIKQATFPGGEVLIQTQPNFGFFNTQDTIRIEARIRNSDDLFALALIKDAIENEQITYGDKSSIELIIPYVPYARQDRTCCKGEPHSLKVFAKFINNLNFDRVIVCDPHSDVTGALIDRVKIIDQVQIINDFTAFCKRVLQGVLFVSPDAGANKKTANVAKYFDHIRFIRADKLRDLATGKIIETSIFADDLNGADIVIADDICDGGRTFIELAKSLKKKNAGNVILYVTHGIFSQGVDTLFANGIDEIYTTNSYSTDLNIEEKNKNKLYIHNLTF
jgi:ribose-phosphate pyrophosphokinase